MENDKQIEILVGDSDPWSSRLSRLNGCTLDNLDDIAKMVREYRPMIDAIKRGASKEECRKIRKELADKLEAEYKVYMYAGYQSTPSVYSVTPGEFAIVYDSRDMEILVTTEMMHLGEIYIF